MVLFIYKEYPCATTDYCMPFDSNDGAYLLCKMADDRGVFPGHGRFRVAAWSLANKLKRHYARNSRRAGRTAAFDRNHAVDLSDDIRTKTYADGRKEEIYMIT